MSNQTKNGNGFKDMTGQKFNKLTFVEYAGKIGNECKWICECECGNRVTVGGSKVRSGHTTNCGCVRNSKTSARSKTHGMSKLPEYRIWQAMKERCYNDQKRHSRYFGRNIQVCSGWRNSFENFFSDLGRRPSRNYSLDRKNSDGNYSCGHCDECLKNKWSANCKWSTRIEQNSNRHTNVKVKYNDELITLAELSRRTNISRWTLRSRIFRDGISPEKAVSMRTGRTRPNSLKSIAARTGIKYMTLYNRVKVKGMAIEEAISTPNRYKKKE